MFRSLGGLYILVQFLPSTDLLSGLFDASVRFLERISVISSYTLALGTSLACLARKGFSGGGILGVAWSGTSAYWHSDADTPSRNA